jgi:protein TonB
VEGRVLLRVWILDDGGVQDVKVYRSSGDESLDRSALSTVRDRWRFAPGRRGGFAVPCEVILPIRFRSVGQAS